MSYNAISGGIPSGLFNIPKLTHVYLHRNKLDGFLPSSVCTSPVLQVLCLQSNSLSGSPPSGWTQDCLKELHLHDNNFLDSDLSRIRLRGELRNCEFTI